MTWQEAGGEPGVLSGNPGMGQSADCQLPEVSKGD